MSNGGIPTIDLSSLRISQDFLAQGGSAKKVHTTIPSSRPDKQHFFRIRSEPEFKFQTYLLEYKEKDRTTNFLVDRTVWEFVRDQVTPRVLMFGITKQENPFLWPIKLPGNDGRSDRWGESALVAAKHAESRWVRVSANMSLGAYEVHEAIGSLSEPEWPELSMEQIINIAFRDRYIDNSEHPIIRKLRGEQ